MPKRPARKSPGCAAKLAVLADPTRLAVIEVLLGGSQNVTEINRRVRVAQNLLSHHLRILRDAEIVTACRDGKAVKYALASGVEMRSSQPAIDLGCCSLQFKSLKAGKNV